MPAVGFRLQAKPAWVAVALAVFSATVTAQAPAPLPAETLGTRNLDPAQLSRVYVADVAISHISDGRIRVFDAQQGSFLGMVSTAYAGNFTVNPQAKELYVATTHLSRSTRGERTDVLEVHDTDSLGFKFEVVLPPKRAQALNYRGLVRTNSTGQWVMVQNATPATSITVVDVTQRRVLSEVPTPGCWGILPAASHAMRFSMLCGDGKVMTLTLNEQGQVTERQASEKLFDPDEDAWFHHAEQVQDRYWFLSFKGILTELDLGGAVAVKRQAWPVVGPAARAKGWRPGGYQNFAVHPDGKRAVLAMHSQGGEGSHKRPAQALWTVDLTNGQRLSSVPGRSVISLTFSRSGDRLQALDGEKGGMLVWKWGGTAPQKMLTQVAKAGEASMHLESHD